MYARARSLAKKTKNNLLDYPSALGISAFARGGGSHAGSISVSTEHAPDDAFHERDRVHMGCQ